MQTSWLTADGVHQHLPIKHSSARLADCKIPLIHRLAVYSTSSVHIFLWHHECYNHRQSELYALTLVRIKHPRNVALIFDLLVSSVHTFTAIFYLSSKFSTLPAIFNLKLKTNNLLGLLSGRQSVVRIIWPTWTQRTITKNFLHVSFQMGKRTFYQVEHEANTRFPKLWHSCNFLTQGESFRLFFVPRAGQIVRIRSWIGACGSHIGLFKILEEIQRVVIFQIFDNVQLGSAESNAAYNFQFTWQKFITSFLSLPLHCHISGQTMPQPWPQPSASGNSKSNGDITVVVPPPHHKYYLPGGDLHVIVGTFDRFQLLFHSDYFVTFDRYSIGGGHPFPRSWLFFLPRLPDLSIETEPGISGSKQRGHKWFPRRFRWYNSTRIRDTPLGIL